MNENVELWLQFAREDIQAARELMKADLFNQCCFHAQQGAEKALKAEIAATGHAPPKLHSLAELHERSSITLENNMADAIQELDTYYIPSRYPDALPGIKPSGMPGRTDAEAAIETAATLLEIVEMRH